MTLRSALDTRGIAPLTICDTAAAPSAETPPRNAAVRAALAVLGADSPIATQAGASVVAIEVAGTDEEQQSRLTGAIPATQESGARTDDVEFGAER
jgi:hypothetical protein